MDVMTSIFRETALQLLTRLETRGPGGQCGSGRVVYITGAGAGEGKTFVARALAMACASAGGNRIALVDGNMERPWSRDGAADAPGLSDWLSSQEPVLPEAASPELDNLHILPAGRSCMPGLLFKREAVAQVLSNLAAQYDLIFVDGAGLSDSGANSVLYQADGILLVVDGSRSRREVVQSVISGLGIEPERFIGAILNKKIHYIPGFVYARV